MRARPHAAHPGLVAWHLVTAALFLSVAAAPVRAERFLLTVQEGESYFLVLIDGAGNVLSTSPPEPESFGPGRFYPGGLWASFDGDAVRLFSTAGGEVGSIDVTDGWLSMDVFPDGRIALRDAWATSDVLVHGPDGALLSNWPTGWCPGGPEYGLRVVGNDEVWVSVECGSYLRRHDAAGGLLAQTLVPGGTGSIWDDSSDDFDAAPDGTIWVWQGYAPSTVSRIDWDGNVVTSLTIPDAASGIACGADGSVWVCSRIGRAIHHLDPSGATLGIVTWPPSWEVWSFDLSDGEELGEPFCLSTPNSTGHPATIFATGSTSIAANDLVLHAGPVPPQPGIFFYGAYRLQLPFGDGFRCVGGSVVRSPALAAGGGLLEWAIDLAAPAQAGITIGAAPHFQAWFRDPAAGGSGYNLSNALTLAFAP